MCIRIATSPGVKTRYSFLRGKSPSYHLLMWMLDIEHCYKPEASWNEDNRFDDTSIGEDREQGAALVKIATGQSRVAACRDPPSFQRRDTFHGPFTCNAFHRYGTLHLSNIPTRRDEPCACGFELVVYFQLCSAGRFQTPSYSSIGIMV